MREMAERIINLEASQKLDRADIEVLKTKINAVLWLLGICISGIIVNITVAVVLSFVH